MTRRSIASRSNLDSCKCLLCRLTKYRSGAQNADRIRVGTRVFLLPLLLCRARISSEFCLAGSARSVHLGEPLVTKRPL